MAAKNGEYRYETKLRRYHAMYNVPKSKLILARQSEQIVFLETSWFWVEILKFS